jgi:hypothetical protein
MTSDERMELLYQKTLDRFDRLSNQLSRGIITNSEYEDQRNMVLLDFSIGVKNNLLDKLENLEEAKLLKIESELQ